MSGRAHQLFVVVTTLLSLAATLLAGVLLWRGQVTRSDVLAFAVMYALTGLGITAGYHRMLSHRAFRAPRAVRVAFVVAGAMAGQGPPLIWAAHHRRHHRASDRRGDPHSPYPADAADPAGALAGLWHAHIGWLLDRDLTSDPLLYCPDLVRDRDVLFVSRAFFPIMLAGLLIPGVIGLLVSGTVMGFLTGVLWGGLVRLFISSQLTYAVNSLGHFTGTRRYATPDESRNVAWLALLSFGDSWHNNHHAFPRSYMHGMRWFEIDLAGTFIRALSTVGLTSELVRIDHEKRVRTMEAFARAGGGRLSMREAVVPLADARRATDDATDIE